MSSSTVLAIFYPGCIPMEILPSLRAVEGWFEIEYATPDGQRLPEMKDAAAKTIRSFRETQGRDYKLVLVPGGDPKSVVEDREIDRILSEAAGNEALIGAVCAGPMLLDKAKVLDGKRIAHGYDAWQIDWLKGRGFFLNCEVTDEKFVQDGRVFTAKPDATDLFTDAILRELRREERIFKTFTAPIHSQVRKGGVQIDERPGWCHVFDPTSREPSANEVVLSVLSDEEAERVVDATIAKHRAHGNPLKWCVGPVTRPLNMGEILTRRGFSSWDVRGMSCDPAKLRLPMPEGVRVERVGLERIEEFVDALLAGWPPAGDLATARKRQLEDFRSLWPKYGDRFYYYLATLGGEGVGTSGFALLGDHAYLFGAQILADYRNRGLYRAMTEARLAELRRLGIPLAVTQAREATSAPILERLGFETVFRSKCYLLQA